MSKNAASEGQQEKTKQKTAGRTEKFTDTTGKIGEYGNPGKTE